MWWALQLYPARWRERYAREFAALLEDVEPGWSDWWDVARGGLKMRMTWNFGTVMAVCGVLGAAVAGGFAMRTPDRYVSTAVLRMEAGELTDEESGRQLGTIESVILSRTSLATIIIREDLFRRERASIPLEDVVQGMRDRNIRIHPVMGEPKPGARAFAISFEYTDRAKAQRVTRDLVNLFLQTRPAGGRAVAMEVLDSASAPQSPSSPNRLAITFVGLLAGALAGLLSFGARRWPLVAVSGMAVALVALGVAFSFPDRWTSTAVLRMDPPAPRLIEAVTTDDVLRGVMEKPPLDLYSEDRKRKPLPEVIAQMRQRDLRITRRGNDVFVSFTYNNRFKAQAVVREFVTRMFEINARQRTTVPQAEWLVQNLEVLDPARLPEQPVSPNRLAILLAGLAVGIGAGTFLTMRRRPRALTPGAA